MICSTSTASDTYASDTCTSGWMKSERELKKLIHVCEIESIFGLTVENRYKTNRSTGWHVYFFDTKVKRLKDKKCPFCGQGLTHPNAVSQYTMTYRFVSGGEGTTGSIR